MKIVLLAGKGESTLYLYNKLNKKFPIDSVIIENGVSTLNLIRSRIKKFGLFKVINQLLFQTIIITILKLFSKSRIKQIKKLFELESNSIPIKKLIKINSVNSNECLIYLKEINPDLIIVNGTRIINKNILSNISVKFINTHVGITPQYRGVHGAYWALVNNDKENCGVTVHLVDEGIDTGDLIKQSIINVTVQDNFVTYPFLQIGVGIELLEDVINQINNDKLKYYRKENTKSNLFTHPTFTEYLYNYFTKNIK
jgi:folate-dependent phosphoribosylglycinamide formyltransferase PurN